MYMYIKELKIRKDVKLSRELHTETRTLDPPSE